MSIEQIDSIALRYARALATVESVQKSREADTGSYTYKYATLSDILAAVHRALSPESLTISQRIDQLDENRQRIVTVLHCTEHGGTHDLPGPIFPIKAEPQATGSQLTYMRRYALVLAFALNVEDDDGQQAQRAATQPNNRTPAETEVRKIIAGLDRDERTRFKDDFTDIFGCGLTDLPESRHGDALTWAKWWTDDERDNIDQPVPEPETQEAPY